MDVLTVDLDKSHRLAVRILKFLSDHVETETLNLAEIAVALNEVAYHIGEASKIHVAPGGPQAA